MHQEDPAEGASARLRQHGLVPRKRLGQNFLRDRSYLRVLLDAADLRREDEALEIGAGTGVLTEAILHRARRVVAIELDDSLFKLLQSQLTAEPNLELWHGNALEFDPGTSFVGPYKLFGNIPYYITGPLIRRFLEVERKPTVLIFMVQREVAERIIARPGHLSILGVSVQYYADADIVARVPARAFYPVPKVDSAILRLRPKMESPTVDPDTFFPVVKAGFSMKRKQLGNSLSAGLHLSRDGVRDFLRQAGIDETRRAETLSVAEWEALTRVIAPSEPAAN